MFEAKVGIIITVYNIKVNSMRLDGNFTSSLWITFHVDENKLSTYICLIIVIVQLELD